MKKEINLQLYIHTQQKFIEDWYENPQKTWEASHFFNLGSVNKKIAESIEFLPEPYLGNPLGSTGVFLNYNPGPVIKCKQNRLSGDFIIENKAVKDYSKFAVTNKYMFDTKGFWGTRRNFLSRLSNFPIEQTSFFALEICPWHSSSFRLSHKDLELSLDYIQKEVLTIAETVAAKSHFKTIFTVGKNYYDVFKLLEFKLVKEINESHNIINWPIKPNGSKVKRSISIWESSTDGMYFNTYAPGSNRISSKQFDQIILEELNLKK
jgi:hypothetical protein